VTVNLTWELLEGFAGTYLSPMYDDVQPTPLCHREWWQLYCAEHLMVGVAAPRGHAKSTALTHDYSLANVLFRVEPHVLLVSATEELSLGHLGDIAKELRDNDELRAAFLIDKFLVDSKGEIIVRCHMQKGEAHPYEFRLIARGAGQKLRGLKWNGRRPGLIICDDMEEDEQVENVDRRSKFRKWVMRALLPLGRRGCKIRWHGTILHEDAMLARIMKDPTWVSRLYKAHEAFDDFSNILWPEMWSEERLKTVRQGFIAQGDPAGYSQEYLNDPFDNSEAYIRKDDLLPMDDRDHKVSKVMAVGCDFAVSKRDKANKTSFTVGGKDSSNLIHVVDQRADRWDTLEWLEVMFEIEAKWAPEYWFVEDGVIWKSMWPTLKKEMRERGVWLNCVTINPVSDKATRGRPFQRRSRAGGMRYDKDASWYGVYEGIVLRFTGTSDAVQDDEFDSTALLVKGFDTVADVEDEDFDGEDEQEFKRSDPRESQGRNQVTGY
jgi:hypothetical protein